MHNIVHEYSCKGMGHSAECQRTLDTSCKKGAQAIAPVAEELCGMIYAFHVKTAMSLGICYLAFLRHAAECCSNTNRSCRCCTQHRNI